MLQNEGKHNEENVTSKKINTYYLHVVEDINIIKY